MEYHFYDSNLILPSPPLPFDYYTHGDGGPLIVIGEGGHRNTQSFLEVLDSLLPKKAFSLLFVYVGDWNADFSPWPAPAAFGESAFAGLGEQTLDPIVNSLLPAVKAFSAVSFKTYIAGYSLAGLFALWSFLSTDVFDGCASCSGSLWFPGFIDFVKARLPKNKESVYLSLGGKEERTKNPLMASVGDCTREVHSLLNACPGIRHTTLKWNPGGHFTNPELRLAQGIAWLITQK